VAGVGSVITLTRLALPSGECRFEGVAFGKLAPRSNLLADVKFRLVPSGELPIYTLLGARARLGLGRGASSSSTVDASFSFSCDRWFG
jgi:hypothetical protein